MFKVCGFKKVDYVSKKDNLPRKGYEVYLVDANPHERSNIEGAQTAVVWLNAAYSAYAPVIGDSVRLSYNRFGRVDDLISAGGVE